MMLGAAPADAVSHNHLTGTATRRITFDATGPLRHLLRGEDLELVSRELGVTAAELSAWRDAFLAAGEASLTQHYPMLRRNLV